MLAEEEEDNNDPSSPKLIGITPSYASLLLLFEFDAAIASFFTPFMIGYNVGISANLDPVTPFPVDKPMGDLTRLRQRASLAEFNVRFDAISAKLDLTEEYLIDIYVAGLKDNIADSVLLFDPRTLGEARRLARIQELANNRKESKAVNDRTIRFTANTSSVSA